MRIAHLITRMILGGAQENTLFTCEDLLHRHGDEVLLLTGPPLGPEGSLLTRAEQHRVPLEIIPALRREIHPWRDWQAYREIHRALKSFRPEVVHTHSAKAGILGRQAAASLKVPAIIHTVHGAPLYPDQGRLEYHLSLWAERRAARQTDAFICVADAMTDVLVQHRIANRHQCTTIYSGMEVEPLLQADALRAATRAQLGLTPEQIVIGKVGRLFPLKGQADVLQVARQLVPQFPQLVFLFIGDGILRAELEQQAADAGLTQHVLFTGLVPPERIPALLSACEMVVHTSLREGLARVLPQALLAGKPVVSYDVDGAREVVKNGETGTLVRPRDLIGLQAALRALIVDSDLRARWGATGRDRCREPFRHEHMTAQIRQVYEKVLKDKHAFRQD